MEIVDLVSDLLYRHNCVIIPGLGGFVANYSQAKYKEDSHTVYPARKRIAFNQSLSDNDGLLISKLSRYKNITYLEAESLIDEFAANVLQRLHEFKSFEFKNLGTFYLTRESKLVFVPYEGLNMLPGSFGLSPVKLRPIKQTTQFIQEPVITTAEEKVIELQAEPKVSKQTFLKRIWPWVSSAAVVMFLGLAYQFFSQTEFPEWTHSKDQKAGYVHFDSAPEKEVNHPPVIKEQAKEVRPEKATVTEKKPFETPVKQKITTIEEQPQVDQNKSESKTTDPDWLVKWKSMQAAPVYHISLGSSGSLAEIERKKANFQAKGITLEIVPNGKSWILSFEKFTIEKNAKEYFQLIRRSYSNAQLVSIHK